MFQTWLFLEPLAYLANKGLQALVLEIRFRVPRKTPTGRRTTHSGFRPPSSSKHHNVQQYPVCRVSESPPRRCQPAPARRTGEGGYAVACCICSFDQGWVGAHALFCMLFGVDMHGRIVGAHDQIRIRISQRVISSCSSIMHVCPRGPWDNAIGVTLFSCASGTLLIKISAAQRRRRAEKRTYMLCTKKGRSKTCPLIYIQ